MRLQFNLLPDVKQQYLKSQRTQATVVTGAFVVAAIAAFILLFMLTTVYIVNRNQLNDANNKITNANRQLQGIPNLSKILTVQNQLATLPGLHQSKHITSRLYEYLPQLTPTNVHMGKVAIDFTANTMQIEGTADSQKTINTFIDTLKFTTYKSDGNETKKKAFPSVLESQFGLVDGHASYGLTIQFDAALFSNLQQIKLTVPAGLSTTRSVLDDPNNALFNGDTGKKTTTTTNGTNATSTSTQTTTKPSGTN